jgi:hypothetical protein
VSSIAVLHHRVLKAASSSEEERKDAGQQEDKEKNLGDANGYSGDARKTENTGDNRNNQKDQCVVEHDHTPSRDRIDPGMNGDTGYWCMQGDAAMRYPRFRVRDVESQVCSLPHHGVLPCITFMRDATLAWAQMRLRNHCTSGIQNGPCSILDHRRAAKQKMRMAEMMTPSRVLPRKKSGRFIYFLRYKPLNSPNEVPRSIRRERLNNPTNDQFQTLRFGYILLCTAANTSDI